MASALCMTLVIPQLPGKLRTDDRVDEFGTVHLLPLLCGDELLTHGVPGKTAFAERGELRCRSHKRQFESQNGHRLEADQALIRRLPSEHNGAHR